MSSAQIFISYASQDESTANEVLSALERAGLSCWIAHRDGVAGTSFRSGIARAIANAKVLLWIASRASAERPEVVRELEYAASIQRPIVPFRIEEFDLPPQLGELLAGTHWLDGSKRKLRTSFITLENSLRSHLGKSAAESEPHGFDIKVPLNRCPMCLEDHHRSVKVYGVNLPKTHQVNRTQTESGTSSDDGNRMVLAPQISPELFQGGILAAILALVVLFVVGNVLVFLFGSVFAALFVYVSSGFRLFGAAVQPSRSIFGLMLCPRKEHPFWLALSFPRGQVRREGYFVDSALLGSIRTGSVTWLKEVGLDSSISNVGELLRSVASTSQSILKRRWIAWLRGALLVLLFTCILYLGLGVVTLVTQKLGFPVSPAVQLTPSSPAFALSVGRLIVVFAAVAIAWTWLQKGTWSELGLTLRENPIGKVGIGFTIGGILTGIIVAVIVLTRWGKFVNQPESLSPMTVFLEAVLLLVLCASEELVFRGFLLQTLGRCCGRSVGIAISSVLFAVVHIGNPDVNVVGFVSGVAQGVFLCAAVLAFRSLWVAIGFHWAWNFFLGVIFGFPVSGFRLASLLKGENVTSHVFFGTPGFGPEAGLLSALCLFVGVALAGYFLAREAGRS